MKFSKYFGPLAYISLASTLAMADGPGFVEPILTTPTLPPVDSGLVTDYVPSSYANQIQVTLQFNPNDLIRADRGFIRIDLMSKLRNELRRNGLSDQPELYLLQNMQLTAKSNAGEGIARLCFYQNGLGPRSKCDTIVNQYILAGTHNQFDDPRSWNTYPLFASHQPLPFPVDIELTGYVRIMQITLSLQIVNSGIVQPSVPPIGGPFPGGGHPHVPPQLLGRNIMFNSGRPIQIGEKARLEKSLSGRNTHLNVATQNYVFAKFNWIEVTSLENASVVDRISVNCLDDRGHNASFRATDSRGNLIENLLIRPGETLVLPVARGCTFIEVVKISGYSPNASGSRARIIVNLK